MNEQEEQKIGTMLALLARDLRSSMRKQDELYQKLMDPETGITARVTKLESWKQTYSRFFWITVSSIIALGFSATIWTAIFK